MKNTITKIKQHGVGRIRHFGLLLMLMVISNLSFAQTVTIGTGTLTTSGTNGVPIYRSSTTSSFNHSKSIQLLTQSQLSAAGIASGAIINSWAYNKTLAGTVAGTNAFTLRVYLKNTTNTVLASGTAWNTMISGATLAYSATITSANMPSATGYWAWPTSGFTYSGGAIEAYIEWFPAGTVTSPFSTAAFQFQYTASGNQAMGTSASAALAGTTTSYTTQARFYNTQINYTPGAPCAGLPNAGTLSPAGPLTKCANQTQVMSVTGATNATGITYSWEVSSTGGGVGFAPVVGGTGANTTNYTTGALIPGTYYYRMVTTCTNTNDAAPSAELTVDVNALPSVAVSASSSVLCPGASASTLTATGAETYAWSPTTGLTPTIGSPVDALPTSSTIYTVTGTDANGCTSTSSVSITSAAGVAINNVSATPNSVCPNGSSVLQASAQFITSAYCQSTHTSGCSGDNIASVTLNTLVNTNSACGLTGSTPPRYLYQTGPTAPTTTLTASATYTLTLSFGTDPNQYFGAWIDYDQNGLLETTEFTGASLNAGASGTSSVVFSIPAGALNGKTRLRIVGGNDATVLNTNACGASSSGWGETQDYDVTISGGVDPFSYTWSESPANSTLASLTGNPVNANNIPSTTTYYVTATSSLGCSASSSATVIIDPLSCTAPTVPSLICAGQSFNVMANITGGGAPFTYVWDDGMMGVYPNSPSLTLNLVSGSYSYTVTVLDACGASCSSSFSILVNDTPTGTASGTTTAFVGDNLSYSVTGYTGTPNFQWQSSATATGPWTNVGLNADTYTVATAPVGKTYVQCVMTNANGCSLTTNQVVTTVFIIGDNVCNPIALPYGISGPYTNVGGTVQVGEPVPAANGCNVQNGWCNSTLENSVWFSFVAPPSGRVTINTATPLWDNQMALYSATSCNDFTSFVQLAANDDGGDGSFAAKINAICLVPGQTYYLQLDGYSGATNAAFNINLINETAGVALASKAILSGAYDLGTGLMHDSLRSIGGLIPTTEPYTGAPFNKPAIGEASGETTTAGVLGVTGNNAIVDWVFLEVRSAATPSVILATKRALIQRDGDIVGVDGVSPVNFTSLAYGTYHVSLKHRNHLGVMTANPVTLGPCVYGTIDFTSMPLWVKLGELNGPAKMYGSVATLWAADANNNRNTKYNGLANDKTAIAAAVGAPNNVLAPVYRMEDTNLDGKVKYNNTDNDRNVVAAMVGVSTPNNIVNQHTPN
ncbi:MAG: hypothetical protein IPI46_10955 [Bacteroidetes bacterium]|nr:hypothetical protein [Bacteroidota bacterium]